MVMVAERRGRELWRGSFVGVGGVLGSGGVTSTLVRYEDTATALPAHELTTVIPRSTGHGRLGGSRDG